MKSRIKQKEVIEDNLLSGCGVSVRNILKKSYTYKCKIKNIN